MTNVSINLLLIKFRQQFGLRPFAMIFLGALCRCSRFAHLFVHGLRLGDRGARGERDGGRRRCRSLALYYMMQALPGEVAAEGGGARHRHPAMRDAAGAAVLARPAGDVAVADALSVRARAGAAQPRRGRLACACRRPSGRRRSSRSISSPSRCSRGAMALFAAVLGLGRIVWWTEAAWIGWALLAAIPMLAAALVIEHGRANPLLNTRWLGSADILRFAIVTIMARIVLSEQTYRRGRAADRARAEQRPARSLFVLIIFARLGRGRRGERGRRSTSSGWRIRSCWRSGWSRSPPSSIRTRPA